MSECANLAAAVGWRHDGHLDGRYDGRHDDKKIQEVARSAAEALRRHGPAVAVKLGAAGGLLVGPEGVTRVHGRPVAPVDTTGAGDCFNAGFIAGLLDAATPTDSLKRAVSSGAIAVTGWGGTGRLASRKEALSAAAGLTAEHLPPN